MNDTGGVGTHSIVGEPLIERIPVGAVSVDPEDGKRTSTTLAYTTGGLAVLSLLAVAERVYGIDRQSLWSDELFAVVLSYQSRFADTVPAMIGDGHPPAYVSFMYWYLRVAGYSDFAVRLPSLVFGVAWIPLVYWLGARWFSVRAGLIAAVIVASSYAAVYYSQEARAYTMLVAACLVNLAFFFELLFDRSRGWAVRTGFVLSGCFMLYLHYSGFVFLAAEAVCLAASWPFRPDRKAWALDIVLCVAIIALFLPWFGIMYAQLVNQSTAWAVSPVPDLRAVRDSLQMLLAPADQQMTVYSWGAVGIVGLLATHVAGARLLDRRQAAVLLCVAALCVLPIGAYFVKSIVGTPIFVYRYFLFVLPLVAVMLAVLFDCGIVALVAPEWRRMVLAAFCVLWTVWSVDLNAARGLYSAMDKDPAREAAAVIAADVARTHPATYTTVMTHSFFEHYLNVRRLTFDRDWHGRHVYEPHQVPEVERYVEANGVDTLYFLALGDNPIEEILIGKYRLDCQTTLTVPTGSIGVMKFDTRGEPGGPEAPDCQIRQAAVTPP